MKTLTRRHKILVLTIFGVLPIVLAFQNCSEVSFRSQGHKDSFKLDNNGTGYNGKPDGTFYRFVPDFSCEQKESPLAVVEISSERVTLTENKQLACEAIKGDINSGDIDASVFQREVIGYKEGIFEGDVVVSDAIPANLVEVWCRDRTDEDGIETITYYNRETKQAVTRLYYSLSGQVKERPDFPVARIMANKEVIIKDQNGFELHVYRDKPASQIGLFIGKLDVMIEGKKESRETYCRLGGSLDPTVWPAKRIVDMNVRTFKTSPNRASFVYTSPTLSAETTVPYLFAASIDGRNPRTLWSNPSSQKGADDFLFTPDSDSIIYNADPIGGSLMQLFRIGINGGSSVQISPKITRAAQSVGPRFELSPDGTRVIFRDASQDSSTFPQIYLKSTPVKGGAVDILNPSFPQYTGFGGHADSYRVSSLDFLHHYGDRTDGQLHSSLHAENIFSSGLTGTITSPGIMSFSHVWRNNGTYDFRISHSQNRVIFQGGGYSSDVYAAFIDGGDIKQITPTLPSSEWKFDFTSPVVMTDSGDFAVVKASRHFNLNTDIKYFVIAVDGSDYTEIPQNMVWMSSSPNDDYSLLRRWHNRFRPGGLYFHFSQMMNMKTGALLNLPPFDSAFFTKDSGALVGIKINDISGYELRPYETWSLEAVSISTVDGTETILCPGLSGNPMNIQEMGENQFLILAFDRTSSILNVSISTAGTCRKVNSVPLASPDINMIRNVVVSPDGLKIISKVGIGEYYLGMVANEISSDLLYIPLDGKPAHIISTPVFNGGRVYQPLFLDDSQTILFLGDQITPQERNVFLWRAP